MTMHHESFWVHHTSCNSTLNSTVCFHRPLFTSSPKYCTRNGVLLIVQTGEAQGSVRIHPSAHAGPAVKQEEPQCSQSQRRALPTPLLVSRGSFCKRVLLFLFHLEISPWEWMWCVWCKNCTGMHLKALLQSYICFILDAFLRELYQWNKNQNML